MQPLFAGHTKRNAIPRGIFWVLLFLCSPAGAWGQRFHAAQVRATADSVLRQRLGPVIIAHTRYDVTIRYRYRNWLGRDRSRDLAADGYTKGHFQTAEVSYSVRLFPTGCAVLDTIRGWTSVALGAQLQLLDARNLDFVPEFVRRQQPCAFLSQQQALIIGRGALVLSGPYAPAATVSYNPDTGLYTWRVINFLTRTLNDKHQPTGEAEVVDIEAATGRILYHYTVVYGQLR